LQGLAANGYAMHVFFVLSRLLFYSLVCPERVGFVLADDILL
jgi:hypothetical protein